MKSSVRLRSVSIMRAEAPYIKLSRALKPNKLHTLALLDGAHLAYYKSPGLFRNDPRFPGNHQTRPERITHDLINAWPVLAVRIRFIPKLSRIVRRVHGKVFDSRDWSLFRTIEEVGIHIIPTLEEVGL